jgi:hypothetical protein
MKGRNPFLDIREILIRPNKLPREIPLPVPRQQRKNIQLQNDGIMILRLSLSVFVSVDEADDVFGGEGIWRRDCGEPLLDSELSYLGVPVMQRNLNPTPQR